jgi:hypothetical protein
MACLLFFYPQRPMKTNRLLQGKQRRQPLAHHHDGYGCKQQAPDL